MNRPKTTLAIKALPLLFVAAALSGCASLSYPLPKCDGYSKRPLNRSMWEWDGKAGPAAPQRQSSRNQPILPFAAESELVTASFSESSVTASYRDCRTG